MSNDKPEKKPIEKSDVDLAFEELNKKLIKEGKMLIRTGSKFAGYEGSTPFIELDQDFQQMPLDRTTLTIPRENITRMFPLAYLAGKLSALQQGTKIGIAMILLFIFVIANLGLTYWNKSTTSEDIKSLMGTISNTTGEIRTELANQGALLQLIAVKENITLANQTIPTVGG